MATMIANDCINCGACEPECPNNAISQGDPIFVIDPKLCTECVGFHDYEACAAVCPVDVCITDPNNVESEEALIARARQIHPDDHSFESRFAKVRVSTLCRGSARGPNQVQRNQRPRPAYRHSSRPM
jgi:ferredoxin